MRAKLCFLALFLICRRIEGQMCSTAAAAQCSKNISPTPTNSNVNATAAKNCTFKHDLCDNTTQACVDDAMECWNASNVAVNTTAAINCCFEHDLCEYTQGCVDDQMEHWNAMNGYASLKQKEPVQGADVFSVLESPWVNISTLSCVQFTYSSGGLPYRLQMFIAFHNDTHSCLGEDSGSDKKIRTAKYSMESSIGKILFQVRGGGAPANVSPPKLYSVTIFEGSCEQHANLMTPRTSPTPAGGNTATERRGNPFSRRDGDYTDIDVATTPSSDINPYDLADDDTNTNGSLGPNLQRLNGSKEDDYSRIDEAQPAAAHSEKNATPERPNPNDVYSVVNKPGKKTPTPGYSLAKIVGDKPTQPNPKDVYSVVNKKGKKFEPATKPGQPDTEYNTISHNGNSLQKAPGDATPDTYNRISAVPSLGLNEKGRASTKPEDGLLTDDYNKLNLAGNGSVKEKRGAADAAYDHVRNDPDDGYSKARIGKRNVVIDSDYHRLKS